MAEEFKFTRNL